MEILSTKNAPNQPTFYGLTNCAEALTLAKQVCLCLDGDDKSIAVDLLLETACAETQLGTYPDHYEDEGHGLLQADTIGLSDVINRTRAHHREKIQAFFGIDISDISPKGLQEDPLKAFIVARLHYKLRPEPIPKSLEQRSHYWKQFYNSLRGSGTSHHYVSSAKRLLYSNWLKNEEIKS